MGRVARLLDRVLWAYQKLTEGRVSPCRYVPSCSTYAREAVAHRGVLRGGLLAVRRLLRCAPWGGWGYDPVPGTDAVTSPGTDAVTATDPHAGHPHAGVGTDPSTASAAASSRRTA